MDGDLKLARRTLDRLSREAVAAGAITEREILRYVALELPFTVKAMHGGSRT